jgi:hypothetical protein
MKLIKDVTRAITAISFTGCFDNQELFLNAVT